MAGATTHNDPLSRVRREQRLHGKSANLSGLRIVVTATVITLAILLFAFGAVGMLMLARSPQEPLAGKLDNTPLVQQTEVAPAPPQAEPLKTEAEPLKTEAEPLKTEAETKTVKTLRVIAPPAPAPEKTEVDAPQPVPSAEPETTATIPNPAAQTQQQTQVPPAAVQQRRQYPQQVRAPAAKKNEAQSDNPLFQLFGIKQYK